MLVYYPMEMAGIAQMLLLERRCTKSCVSRRCWLGSLVLLGGRCAEVQNATLDSPSRPQLRRPPLSVAASQPASQSPPVKHTSRVSKTHSNDCVWGERNAGEPNMQYAGALSSLSLLVRIFLFRQASNVGGFFSMSLGISARMHPADDFFGSVQWGRKGAPQYAMHLIIICIASSHHLS